MAKLIKCESILLKNNPEIKEDTIQSFIFDNPSVLGLGDLNPIQREKNLPQGGRLDILLADEEGTRYEVEIQLGATDPSHIIRTIEYWDSERKRYPQYNHCAVIVAEDITNRFMNVISLFNGNIPLIALKMTAFKQGNDISLAFTKVLDKVTYANDEETQYEPTDRKYWEIRSSKNMLSEVDNIFSSMKEIVGDYELKYNKFYIGLSKDGVTKNLLTFHPKKNWLYIEFKGDKDDSLQKEAEDNYLELTWKSWNAYSLKLKNYKDYEDHKEFIDKMVKRAMGYFNL